MAKWIDGDYRQLIRQNLLAAMREIALTVEGKAKDELYRPPDFPQSRHGVETGTLRRDIRTEGPEADGRVVKAQVGAWAHYALPVHQGHHGFEGYHYITNGLDKTRPKVDLILKRHQVKR